MRPLIYQNGDGTGANARFESPAGIAYVYVNDGNIRKVVISTRVVSTEVVSKNAGLLSPRGVALDGQGHLYITDEGRDLVLKMDLKNKQITTLAGAVARGYVDATGPNARFNGPDALSSDNVGNLYLVEGDNHAVRRVNMCSGRVTTLVGIRGVKGVFLEEPLSLNTPTAAVVISPSKIAIVDENSILLAE